MSEEIESKLIQDVRELDAVAYSAAAGDGTDGGRMMPDQKRGGDSDATDGTDGDGTDGVAEDTDGTDSEGDSDGTDSSDSDGTDNA